LIKIEENQLTS